MDYKEFTNLGQQAMMLTEGLLFSEEDYRSNVDKWIRGEDNILFIIGMSGSGKTTLGDELAEKYGCKIIHMDYFSQYRKQQDPSLKDNPRRNDILFNDAIREIGDERGIIEGNITNQIEKFRHRPIIMKRTSMVTSDTRQLKRSFMQYDHYKDWKTPYNGPVDTVFKVLNHSFGNMKRNLDIYKDIKHIEQQLNESDDTYDSRYGTRQLTTNKSYWYSRDDSVKYNESVNLTESASQFKYRLYKDFNEFCENINTPEEWIEWFKQTKHVFSRAANEKYMTWPDDLVRGKPSICFDHAFLGYMWAKRKELPCRVLYFGATFKDSNNMQGHIIPVVKYNNKVVVMDVQGFDDCSKSYLNYYEDFNDIEKKICSKDWLAKYKSINDHPIKEFKWAWVTKYELDWLASKINQNLIQSKLIDQMTVSTLFPQLNTFNDVNLFNGKIKFTLNPTLGFILNNVTQPIHMIKSLYHKYFDESVSPGSVSQSKSKYRLYDSFDEFCENINTPEEMRQWFIRTKHKWPMETSQNKRPTWPDEIVQGTPAICFDHAFFIYRWAKRKGYEAHIFWEGSYPSNEYRKNGWIQGHVVPFVKYNEKYVIIDVQSLPNQARKDANSDGTYLKWWKGQTFKELKEELNKFMMPKKKELQKQGLDQFWIWYTEYDINKVISYESKKNIPTIDELCNRMATGVNDNPISEFFNGKIHIEWAPTSGLLYFINNIFKDPKTTIASLYHKYFSESGEPLFDFTFYHGSPDKIIKFEPIAPNMGNQLEPPKWVVYMFMNKDFARRFAISRVLDRNKEADMLQYPIILQFDTLKGYCLDIEYETIRKILLNKILYIYTLKVDPNTIGVGHSLIMDEYTTTDSHPEILHVDEIKITDNIIQDCFIPVDLSTFKRMHDEQSYQRPTFANIMLNQDDVFRRVKSIRSMIKQGSVDPRKDNIQQIVQDLIDKENMFKDFKTIEDLGKWIWDNVKPFDENSDDNRFIWPKEILTTKKISASCFDVANLLHMYCVSRNMDHRFGRIGITYTNNAGSKIVNSQSHIVLLYKDKKDRIWRIIQNDGPDKIRKIVFKGNTSESDTLELFVKAFLPHLINWVKSRKPNSIIKEKICQICSKEAIGKFDREYMDKNDNKTHANKQKIIRSIFE